MKILWKKVKTTLKATVVLEKPGSRTCYKPYGSICFTRDRNDFGNFVIFNHPRRVTSKILNPHNKFLSDTFDFFSNSFYNFLRFSPLKAKLKLLNLQSFLFLTHKLIFPWKKFLILYPICQRKQVVAKWCLYVVFPTDSLL